MTPEERQEIRDRPDWYVTKQEVARLLADYDRLVEVARYMDKAWMEERARNHWEGIPLPLAALRALIDPATPERPVYDGVDEFFAALDAIPPATPEPV